MNRALATDFIAHHLRLFGLGRPNEAHNLSLMTFPGKGEAATARECATGDGVAVAILPEPDFLAEIGVTELASNLSPTHLKYCGGFVSGRGGIKTLHPFRSYSHPQGQAVVVAHDGAAVWLWVPVGKGGFLILGTDIAEDLLRYRQGNPECASSRPTEAQWGFAGERPVYLFEAQLAGEDSNARHADWWAIALAETLAEKLHMPRASILPGGAPGAIVITGDDDQAYLEKYDEQLTLLGDTPITYLLHPLTRHTPKTMRAMRQRNSGVDFGIHPDALEAPQRYNEIFDEQVAWYRGLTSANPVSLRNHGFLNDGYWGHLDAWLKHRVGISSNLPGFDGRILNGSLLPARVVFEDALTAHWSILTAIGDGVRFASGMSDKEAAERVENVADSIRRSGIPGVMVLNMHRKKVSETRAMHHAALEIIRSGFVAWNLRQCWEWFQLTDGMKETFSDGSRQDYWIGQQWRKLQDWLGPSSGGARP